MVEKGGKRKTNGTFGMKHNRRALEFHLKIKAVSLSRLESKEFNS